MNNQANTVGKAGFFSNKGVQWFIAHAVFMTSVHATSRGLTYYKLATSYTMVAIRFQAVLAVMAVLAIVARLREGSWAALRPGDIKMQSWRAVAQTGQSVFVMAASMKLGGGFQSAVSLAMVPFWVTLIGFLFPKADANKVTGLAWLGVFGFVFVAWTQWHSASISAGSLRLGLFYLVLNALCIAALQFLNKAAAKERELTAVLWQNFPAALLCIPFWFHGIAGDSAVRQPTGTLGWCLLIGLVFFSLLQQWAGQVAYKHNTAPVVQLNSLRGVQPMVGTMWDYLLLHVSPTATSLLAFPGALMATWIGWKTARPKKVTS